MSDSATGMANPNLWQARKNRLFEEKIAVTVPVLLNFIDMIDTGTDNILILLRVTGADSTRTVLLTKPDSVACQTTNNGTEPGFLRI